MALRVLLADDSPNIKKVVNLALQSYGVEVKSVPSGEDVIPVAQSFRPDIVISDIMLAKIDGYEICRLIKKDPTLMKTPVVLMWSNFMQLDETKARECGADARLEKPFEQEELRTIVQTFVQKTKSNPLSEFLHFPDIGPQSFEEPAQQLKPKEAQPTVVMPAEKKPTSPLSSPLLDEESDQFARTDLKFKQTTPEISPLASSNINEPDESEPWTETNLDRFKITSHGVDNSPDIDVDIPDVELPIDDFPLTDSGGREFLSVQPSAKPTKAGADNRKKSAEIPSALDPKQIENLIQAQIESKIQASIDAAIWKILPEIAERVIREELNKLLKDIEL